MAKKLPLPHLTEAIAARVRKADYQQGRHGTCLICKGNWDDCPHSTRDIDLIIRATEMVDVLGIGPRN